MPSYFQTALMLGNAVQHALDTKKLSRMAHDSNKHNGDILANMLGWNQLGAGHFSTVYDNPYDTETVFKMNIHKEGKGPDAWIDYAAWCMRHSDEDPHFLKVYEIAVFPECFIAIMEKLQKADGDSREILHAYAEYIPCPTHLTKRVDDFHVAAERVRSDIGLDDLHLGNVMNRDGQLVITDPLEVRSKRSRYEDYLNGHRIERERTVLAASSEVLTARPA